MNARFVVYGVIAVCIAADVPVANAQDAKATIQAAQYALGMIRGPRRIDAVATLEYWGSGTAGGANVTYHASLSYILPAMRVDRMGAQGRQIQVVSGQFAWDESVPGGGFIPGTTAAPMPEAVNQRLLELWTTPFGALKAAERAGSNAKVSKESSGPVIAFPLSANLAGVNMRISLNAKNQIERVETTGKLATETTYSEYKDLGEIKSDVFFPSRIVEKREGRTVLDLTITKTDPNNPYVVFPVPQNVEKSAPAR